MIVTRTSGSWSCARSASSSATRSGVEIALRLSGRFNVIRRTNCAGVSTMINSSDTGRDLLVRAGQVGEQLQLLGAGGAHDHPGDARRPEAGLPSFPDASR